MTLMFNSYCSVEFILERISKFILLRISRDFPSQYHRVSLILQCIVLNSNGIMQHLKLGICLVTCSGNELIYRTRDPENLSSQLKSLSVPGKSLGPDELAIAMLVQNCIVNVNVNAISQDNVRFTKREGKRRGKNNER